VTLMAHPASATEPRSWNPEHFGPGHVFDLEWVQDPQIAPDGRRIVYLRTGFDVMKDGARTQLWTVRSDGRDHRPLVDGFGHATPRWSPDGKRLVFSGAGPDGRPQLFVHWLDSGRTAPITRVPEAPRDAQWSPDGRWLALVMKVPAETKPMVKMPAKPEGAEWAPPAKVVDRVYYRFDGQGFVDPGFSHVFVVPSDGGTPRQLTTGDFNHSHPRWTPDGKALLIDGDRSDDWEMDPVEAEIYRIEVADGKITQLTDRDGPDASPEVSPDGRRVAYVGFTDRRQGYQVAALHVMDIDGKNARVLTGSLDRTVEGVRWNAKGDRLTFLYDDRGNTKLGQVDLKGKVTVLAGDVGGTSLGRPYASGSYSAARDGSFVFTRSRPEHPGDLALVKGKKLRTLVRLNEDLLGPRALAPVEELIAKAPDGKEIQAWMAKPPGFDPNKKYPMILEIHGGPFANYGDRFSAEVQLYASAGFVVVYANPRGSTSYGEAFGNAIHHAYPGEDYGDLMACVDAAIAKGFVDEERLFVTGGSGGGVLTAWIVGKTKRFRAAVVAKPVINWASFALYADVAPFFVRYWFPAMPWEAPDHYWKRSPLSLVGNVETPTMLLTGEADYRTPIAESEQYYQALKIRGVDTALVRIPQASHGIARRPSHLISKVLHILAWFDGHDRTGNNEKAKMAEKTP
ncbi:MAG: S9 family peptidase, partial [Myxococcota bacterium]